MSVLSSTAPDPQSMEPVKGREHMVQTSRKKKEKLVMSTLSGLIGEAKQEGGGWRERSWLRDQRLEVQTEETGPGKGEL